MADIDNTREKLNIDNMNANERKALFNKFRDGGGEIESERQRRRRSLVIDKNARDEARIRANNRRKQSLDEDRQRRRKNYSEADRRTEASKGGGGEKKSGGPPKEGMLQKFVKNLKFYFAGVLGGATDISGKNINRAFLHMIDTQLLTVLLEAEAFIGAIIYPVGDDKKVVEEKQQTLEEEFQGTYIIELLERYYQVYDETLFSELLREYRESKGALGVDLDEKVHVLKEIFRSVYVLRNYTSTIIEGAEKGLQIYAKAGHLDKTYVTQRLTTIRRSVEMLYNKLYPRLFILIRIIAKEDFQSGGKGLSEYLKLEDYDEVGYYTREKIRLKQQREHDIDERVKNDPDKDKKKGPSVDKYTAKGLLILKNLVTYDKEANNILDEANPLYYLDENDKIYRAKTIMDLFDREYSIVLTTNKIKYNTIYDRSEKTDYANEFGQCLSDANEVNHRLKDYLGIMHDIYKTENDQDLPYEHRLQLLQTKQVNRSKYAKIAKARFVTYTLKIKKLLERLLRKKSELDAAILNKNDRLIFDPAIHGKKRVSGYTVLQALTETYFVISAFHHLVAEGELAGAGLVVEEAERKPEGAPMDSAFAEGQEEGAPQEMTDDDDGANDEATEGEKPAAQQPPAQQPQQPQQHRSASPPEDDEDDEFAIFIEK